MKGGGGQMEKKKQLSTHLKAAKDEKKKATIVYDHLNNGKKLNLDEDSNLQQKEQEVGRIVNEKESVHCERWLHYYCER